MNLKSFLQGFGILAVILTLIPLIAADFWWIRMFDYPHIQLTLVTLTAIAAYFIKFEIRAWRDYLFMVVLISCFIFQFSKLYPYTPFSPFEAGKPTAEVKEKSGLKIMTSNVLQKNKKSGLVIAEVKKIDPDIVIFTETDQRWLNELEKGL